MPTLVDVLGCVAIAAAVVVAAKKLACVTMSTASGTTQRNAEVAQAWPGDIHINHWLAAEMQGKPRCRLTLWQSLAQGWMMGLIWDVESRSNIDSPVQVGAGRRCRRRRRHNQNSAAAGERAGRKWTPLELQTRQWTRAEINTNTNHQHQDGDADLRRRGAEYGIVQAECFEIAL